jgi:hypothetical protein
VIHVLAFMAVSAKSRECPLYQDNVPCLLCVCDVSCVSRGDTTHQSRAALCNERNDELAHCGDGLACDVGDP